MTQVTLPQSLSTSPCFAPAPPRQVIESTVEHDLDDFETAFRTLANNVRR